MKQVNIPETLATIIANEVHNCFGEPFLSAFKSINKDGDEEELLSAAFICSLFLSVIMEDFPTGKLNIFVRYTRDNCSRFIFDCKMYDTIFRSIQAEELKHVALIDKTGTTCFRECNKQDIFEALDFYTNR